MHSTGDIYDIYDSSSLSKPPCDGIYETFVGQKGFRWLFLFGGGINTVCVWIDDAPEYIE